MNGFLNIQRQLEDGICALTFDRPGSSANVFDQLTFAELNAHLDFIDTQTATIRGVIFQTAKAKIFIAGADLIGFTQSGITAERLASLINEGHQTFERIANLPCPTVAAIHGVCLGGGLELALACDWRVASNDSSTKLGLPEVMLGILPAWGGSTRLPRLIGLRAALGAILTGRQYSARQALKLGLVDALAYRAGLRAAAERMIRRKRGPARTFLSNVWPASQIISAVTRRTTLAKTHGNYPAPITALEVAVKGLSCPHAESLRNEKEAFIELAGTEASRNLMRVFLLQERAKKLKLPADLASTLPAEWKPTHVRQAAVIGAGLMGAGIAQWLAGRGIRVFLKDIGPEPLAKGLHAISQIFWEATKRHVFSPTEAVAALDRIVPISSDIPMRTVDLIIEAAVETLELKQAIFASLEQAAGPATVLATNTSALSIDTIAGTLQRPDCILGIHFFNPVHRMQLVEIVRGTKSSAQAVDTALAFVKSIGKLPVLVRDSPGFLVNRILLPYMAEAVRLFQEGHSVKQIDHIMLAFGMPMGPLRLADEVGLDVARHVAKDLEARLPHPIPMNDILERMMARGWLGRKSGKGFYSHGKDGEKSKRDKSRPSENPQMAELRGAHNPGTVDEAVPRDRMVLVMVNEAARVLEEGIVEAPEDVDFSMIMGTGWAPFRGGPLRYADSRGLVEIVARLELFRNQIGSYFEPCQLLQQRARDGTLFYPEAQAGMNTSSPIK